jgi:formamidopyrimidine-DNA glycosylase
MAEVPEVEILVRDLRAAVVGRIIVGARVLLPEAVRFPALGEFEQFAAGRAVEAATRRAKFMLLTLNGDVLLALHCMLGGTLRLAPAGAALPPDALVVFALENGEMLHFLDDMGYARAAIGQREEVAVRLKLDALGPEALDPAFDPSALARVLAKRRGLLKTVLLNQNVLAGLGNRDADESLWAAGIDPRRAPASLTDEEIIRLHTAIRATLEEGIALRGTMTDLWGRQGQARHRRNVFGRTGQPCPRCGAPIQHLRIGDRNTHFCSVCQR